MTQIKFVYYASQAIASGCVGIDRIKAWVLGFH